MASTPAYCDDRCCTSPSSRSDCCDISCSSCTGSSNTNCLSCNSGYHLDGTTCAATCPAGTFANSIGNICTPCSGGCVTCSGSATSCFSCFTGTFLDGNTCGSSCPSGTFADLVGNICTACSGCATCTTSATNCLSCTPGTFLNGNTCGNSYPSGNYLDSGTGTCITCSGCATCTTSATNCLSCSTGTFLNGNACSASCSAGTYADSGTNTCISCSGCATCAGSATTCTSCSQGFYFSIQTQTCNTYTQGHLAASQFDTRDIYLILNSALYSANIPNLNNIFQLQISNLNTNDYTYKITQVSNTNITFRLSPLQPIDRNTLTTIIQDATILRDSNNEPVVSTISSVTLGYYEASTPAITGLSDGLMATTAGIAIISSIPMIISGGLSALWGVIDVLQYLFYFIYLNMNLPIEYEQFLIYFKVSTIPIPNIPNSWFSSMNQNSGIEIPNLDAPFKFMMFEIDASFLKNGLTYIIYSISFSIMVYVVIFVEKIFHKKTGSNRLKMVVKLLQWNFPLRYILVNITQISFAIFLQFTNFSTGGSFQQTGIAFAILSFISLISFITWTFKQTNSKLFKEDIAAFNLKYVHLLKNLWILQLKIFHLLLVINA